MHNDYENIQERRQEAQKNKFKMKCLSYAISLEQSRDAWWRFWRNPKPLKEILEDATKIYDFVVSDSDGEDA